MQIKRGGFFLICLVTVVTLVSCGSEEKEAKKLMSQAQAMINNGNWIALKKHLDMVVSEYPETRAAETAREMVQKLTAQVNALAETV